MPLYVVRWPGLNASLIAAQDEEELLWIIDQEGTPGSCTWSVYRGPVWVDFDLRATLSTPEDFDLASHRDKVKVKLKSNFAGQPLLVTTSSSTEEQSNMVSAILASAFPNTASALEEGHSELADSLAADYLDQHDRLRFRGVTFDDDAMLVAQEVWTFVLDQAGFRRVDPKKFVGFCHGEATLAVKGEKVRAVELAVSIRKRKPSFAEVMQAVQLSRGPDGLIVAAHRADAFGKARQAVPITKFHDRRNRAVHWTLSDAEKRALGRALEAAAGRSVAIRSWGRGKGA